ncbi:MAG: rod shape-determining protein [Candidatus Falkowbacteria bacterium]
MFGRFMGKFSKDLGIDLGTANTLVCTLDKGIVINEPSVVAIDTRTDEVLAVGEEARKMVGKTPSYIQAVRPLTDGVVSDFEVTEKMLKYFIDKVHSENFTLVPMPRVVIGIPLDITEVEKKAVEDAAKSAGARQVHLVEETMAAAIGVRLPVTEATASMIVDIGGGTTDIAVIALSGCVNWKNLRVAGNVLTNDIMDYVREEFNVLIGEQQAERIKNTIGSVVPQRETMEMLVRGRDLLSGLPKEIRVTDGQVREAMARSIHHIVDNIKLILETTPPELITDIYETGIVLTGGGALLRGLDREISIATRIPVKVADDPLTCVVRGTGILLADAELLSRVAVPSTKEL